MKKSLIFASIACAGAFALHADWTYQDWFTGIGTGATATNDMKATNGTWSFAGVTSGTVSYESGLVFDLEEDESVAFNVTSATAPDTNTWTDVKVSGVFTPVSTNDLPNRTTMEDRSAQVGFVVGINDEPGTNYYAWVGGDDWVKLTGAVNPATVAADAETTLLVTFDYTAAAAAKARFAILTGSGAITTNFLADSSADQWQTLATDARKVSGLSCYGSGKLVKANGAVGLGVASVNDIKYASLADAVGTAGNGDTVKVLRATAENVTVTTSGITIEDNGLVSGRVTPAPDVTMTVKPVASEIGSGSSGEYTLSDVGGSDASKITVELPMANKEVAGKVFVEGGLKVTIRTATSVITAANPGGNKALAANSTKLHQFLADNCAEAYNAADASTETIQTALTANGSNGLQKWESYVLGITPTTDVTPVTTPIGDTETGYIKLAIPELASAVGSGDYTVTYSAGGTVTATPSDIQVPLATGTSDIKVILTPTPVE